MTRRLIFRLNGSRSFSPASAGTGVIICAHHCSLTSCVEVEASAATEGLGGLGSAEKPTVLLMPPPSLPKGGCAFATGLTPLHPPWCPFSLATTSLLGLLNASLAAAFVYFLFLCTLCFAALFFFYLLFCLFLFLCGFYEVSFDQRYMNEDLRS